MKPADRHETASKQLEAAKAQKRAELRARLEEAGWSSVIVKAIGGFTAAGGIDPQGNTRSGCRADGEALIDDLLALGIPNERKRKDEPQLPTAGAYDGLRLGGGDPGSADPGGGDHLGNELDAELNEAIEGRPELSSNADDITDKQALEAQLAEARESLAVALEDVERLKNRPPEIRTVEVPAAVEAPADGIPDEFRGLMLMDESPERFTERMRRRWQALQHLRIDGSKPTNSRALPDMTEEEIAELADLDVRNKTAKWLD